MTDHTARDRRLAAGRDGEEMEDLEQALRCYYGKPYEMPESVYKHGSRNKIALRLGVIADKHPERAAKLLVKEIGAELNSTVHRRRRRFWGDDEPLSSVYESWTGFGRWLAARGVKRSKSAICRQAARMVDEDTDRLAAMYYLLHIEGEVTNLNGRVTYRGPVVRAACGRGDEARVERSSTTPMAHALHGRGNFFRELDPLEQAIVELSKQHGYWGRAGWIAPVSTLATTRMMYPYLIHSTPGVQVDTAILGIKEGGSTGEMRYVSARAGLTVSVYPHRTHRNVGRSNAVPEGNGVRIFGNALPEDGVWKPMADHLSVQGMLGPDQDPKWTRG